jgi:hypothetical protein
MLFDLRSKGRRRAVKVIYSFLALIMVSGLLLVGVGTGGSGGLLNGLENNGSNGTTGVDYGPVNAAIKLTRKDPRSAAAWAALVEARFSAADQGSNYDSTASSYTASGDNQLKLLAQAWSRYQALVSTPSVDVSILAARAEEHLGDFSGATLAWQDVANSEHAESAFYCLTANAYAAKETRVAGLAETETLALTPKLQRPDIKSQLAEAKTSSALALTC